MILINDAVDSIAVILISCELGQRLSEAFHQFNDIIDQCKWYLFPNKLKQILPTILIITQEPVTLECFGSIICSREVFQNVRYSSISIENKSVQLRLYTSANGWLYCLKM